MVAMRVSGKNQHRGISFVQICNESMAAARETGAQRPWTAEKNKTLPENTSPCW